MGASSLVSLIMDKGKVKLRLGRNCYGEKEKHLEQELSSFFNIDACPFYYAFNIT